MNYVKKDEPDSACSYIFPNPDIESFISR